MGEACFLSLNACSAPALEGTSFVCGVCEGMGQSPRLSQHPQFLLFGVECCERAGVEVCGAPWAHLVGWWHMPLALRRHCVVWCLFRLRSVYSLSVLRCVQAAHVQQFEWQRCILAMQRAPLMQAAVLPVCGVVLLQRRSYATYVSMFA